MDIFAATHKGKIRKQNEDAVFISGDDFPVFAIVADGMGGHNAGRVASNMAIALIKKEIASRSAHRLREEDLKEIIKKTSNHIFETATNDVELYQMGTTVALVMLNQNQIRTAHVGDSRIYLFSRCSLQRLTRDHSYVQYLVDKRILRPDEAERHPYRNILTRAVGMQEIEVDTKTAQFSDGDILLLCSDGLTNDIDDREILALLSQGGSAQTLATSLVNRALERGGRDNISVIVIKKDAGAYQ